MEKKPRCPNEALRRLPSYEEVRRYVLRSSREPVSLPKSVSKRALVKYRTRVDKVSSYLAKNFLDPLRALKKVLEVDFYRKVALNAVPGEISADDAINKLLGKLKAAEKISREYKLKVSASFDSKEAAELYREYVGRILSIVRRSSKYIELANMAVAELKKTPCVDPSVPVVAVAGLPQVGKSTLVSAISTAKPKSSPFPFTTKEIIMGHVGLGFRQFQVLDLPGILDRPFQDMNEIERKAFIAVTSIANLVLFLIDPSEDFYFGFEGQLNLLKSLKELVKVGILVAINKVDKVSTERLKEVSRAVSSTLPGAKIFLVSALKGEGLEELVGAILEYLSKLPQGEDP